MSYWAYTDLFEEPGPPSAAFQGGFGLLNPQGIRKPVYFASKYLNRLGELELDTRDGQSMAALDGGSVQVLAWDYAAPEQPVAGGLDGARPIPSIVKPNESLCRRFTAPDSGSATLSCRALGATYVWPAPGRLLRGPWGFRSRRRCAWRRR
jgi:xylan 1,4-beta-xylosidase